jgi:hypothetical protein
MCSSGRDVALLHGKLLKQHGPLLLLLLLLLLLQLLLLLLMRQLLRLLLLHCQLDVLLLLLLQHEGLLLYQCHLRTLTVAPVDLRLLPLYQLLLFLSQPLLLLHLLSVFNLASFHQRCSTLLLSQSVSMRRVAARREHETFPSEVR